MLAYMRPHTTTKEGERKRARNRERDRESERDRARARESEREKADLAAVYKLPAACPRTANKIRPKKLYATEKNKLTITMFKTVKSYIKIPKEKKMHTCGYIAELVVLLAAPVEFTRVYGNLNHIVHNSLREALGHVCRRRPEVQASKVSKVSKV